jgi:CRP-like cAMP-binding protein
MPISNTAPDQMIWVTRNNGGSGFIRLNRDNADSASAQFDVYSSSAGINQPHDIVFDTVHGLYFFADSINGNRRILQGNISDLLSPSGPPALTVLYSDASPGSAGGQILGLAIDVNHATGQGALYFVNQGNLDRVVYDHDGTSPTNQTPAILATLPPGAFANEIALDIDNNRAFILSTASSTEAVEVPEGTPGAIFDEDSGVWFIFATDVTNNEIWQVSGLDRTDSTTADTTAARLNWIGGDNGGQDLQDSLGLLQSIDIDPTTGLLYFTTQQINSGAFGEVGGIYRYNLSAGTYEILYTEGNSTDYSFEYIDVDPVTGLYYVTSASFDDTSGANTSAVFVHALSAGTPTLFASVGNPSGAIPQGVIVVNAPTLNGTETGATTTESAGTGSGQSSAAQALAALAAFDGDSAGHVDQLAGAQVRISSGFGSSPGSTELLTINGTTAGVLDFGSQDITYSYNGLTGVMTLTGASTFDNYEAALALVSYSISGDNPDNNGTSTTRTISYSVHDGMMFSDEFDSAVNIAATNDGPANTTGGAVAVNEDAASVAVPGLSVSDPDNSTLTVTLTVARGTLTLSGTAGLSFGTGDGSADATMTFSGSAAAINGALAGLSYTPTANVNGPDTLTMTTSDGSASDSDNVAISVTAVNDAPTVAGDGTEDAAPIVQDMPSPVGQTVASLFAGQYSDAADQVAGGSSADAFAGVAVTANGSGASGQWQYFNGAIWVNIGPASDGAAVLLSAGTSIRFNPAPGFNGAAPTLTTHLVDASGGAISSGTVVDASVTGGTSRYSGGTVTLAQTVLVGNTAPTGVNGTLTIIEDANNGATVGTVTATDPDSSTFTYSLVNDAGGRFNISSSGVVTVENGLLLDYEQNASHTIRVRVDDNEGGISEFNMNVTVTDQHGEFVTGDGANHIYYGGAETDFLFGGGGSDTIYGQGGIDFIFGGDGLYDPSDGGDTLNGGAGSDVILGHGGDDTIAGGADGDLLSGNEGNDTIYGGSSATDTLDNSNDVLSGDAGNDMLYGNNGADLLYGGADNDQLYGGAGTDTLIGDGGVDRLDGGAGADDLTGGSGFDVFVFRKGQANGDQIFDFDGNGSSAGDTIRLEGYAAGTTFTKVGGDVWKINDHGTIEYVTINSDGNIHPSDWGFFP